MSDDERCCLCGRPMNYGVEPHHGAYSGARARHFACHEKQSSDLRAEFGRIERSFRKSLARLRGHLDKEQRR